MGFENVTPLSVVAYDSETGERVAEFDLASCPDITCEMQTVPSDFISGLNELSGGFTMTITYPKFSRKRFIKKLMGIGVPRNAANQYARYCAETRSPYGRQWNRIYWMGIFG